MDVPHSADPLTAVTDPPLRPLPERAVALLRSLGAPPRLAAHLRLVHDVAYEPADWVEGRYPRLPFDRAAVLFGAATHDIGKVAHLGELSGPGSRHEEAGRGLLLEHGVEPEWEIPFDRRVLRQLRDDSAAFHAPAKPLAVDKRRTVREQPLSRRSDSTEDGTRGAGIPTARPGRGMAR